MENFNIIVIGIVVIGIVMEVFKVVGLVIGLVEVFKVV